MKKLILILFLSMFMISEISAGGVVCGNDGRCNEGVKNWGTGIDKIGDALIKIAEPLANILNKAEQKSS